MQKNSFRRIFCTENAVHFLVLRNDHALKGVVFNVPDIINPPSSFPVLLAAYRNRMNVKKGEEKLRFVESIIKETYNGDITITERRV